MSESCLFLSARAGGGQVFPRSPDGGPERHPRGHEPHVVGHRARVGGRGPQGRYILRHGRRWVPIIIIIIIIIIIVIITTIPGPEVMMTDPPPSTGRAHTGGYWTTLDAFPAFEPTPFFLAPGAVLAPRPPAHTDGLGVDRASYVYDPSDPAPTIGGNNLLMPCGWVLGVRHALGVSQRRAWPCLPPQTGPVADGPYTSRRPIMTCIQTIFVPPVPRMGDSGRPLDQAPLETRKDQLMFSTAPLDEPLAVTGPLTATLFVSSNATDTDFMVRRGRALVIALDNLANIAEQQSKMSPMPH
jgi:hypothetical protein